ncbi:hypothetical protein [Alicycliphilus denitrificans]|uniref:hypothetical protein n=1 Tax=Alicycliphilus denitrificans TaxID=179636 RepID=UPI00384BBA54
MNDSDAQATLLLEEARRFFEKSLQPSAASEGRVAFLHAAILLAFSSLEAHVNAVADEMALRSGLDVLAKSILLEKDYSLEKGEFKLANRLKMYRFEDRLSFLLATFSSPPIPVWTKEPWWSDLKDGIDLRNRLVHPKSNVPIDIDAVEKALAAIVACLNFLYQNIYRRPFPSAKRGINASLAF